jgi:prolyl-tRNA synthetase
MNLQFTDENGKSLPMVMGCYGIGVTRLLGAAIEQNHDDKGIAWPTAIAPFSAVVTPIGYAKSERVRQVADQLYEQLRAADIDVLLDDRDERPGVMFAEMELIGIPHRITIGERGLKEGQVEYVNRRTLQTSLVPIAEAYEHLRRQLAQH